MGVDFSAIMDHHMTELEIHRLPELFNSTASPIAVFQHHADQKCWKWARPREIDERNEIWIQGDAPKLIWHSYMWLYIYRNTVVFNVNKGWYRFTSPEENGYRENLRAACRNLAGLLGSPVALYIPDSAKPESIAWDMADELCVDELIALLKEKCGPPASTIPSMYIDLGELTYDTRGYFIDHFDQQ